MRMHAIAVLTIVIIGLPRESRGELPRDEAGVIAYLSDKGVKIEKSVDGHATKLMSSGTLPLSIEEYQLIGQLSHLEDLGLNGAPLADGEWGFLKKLPKLKVLKVWHAAKFASLQPFSNLPVESLTIGGCMGLRDLNRNAPERLRSAVTTLRDLPNLTTLSLYHCPYASDDSSLDHVAREFPKLMDLRVDFAAPPEAKNSLTPAGMAHLRTLPLNTLRIESVASLSAEHLLAIGEIKTLKHLLIDTRKEPIDPQALAAFYKARPDVQTVVSATGDKAPPQVRPAGSTQ